MPHRIFVHVAWTTRARERVIDRVGAQLLRALLPRIARQERASVLELGIVRSHVHLLMQLHPTTAIPRLLQRLKGGTSVMLNRERLGRSRVRWAKGYWIGSVGRRQLAAVRSYVRAQAARHPDEALEEDREGPRP